jgi:hypothetical protein
MKHRGFTLVELLIGVVFALIVGTLLLNGASALSGGSTLSFGLNGVTEMRCINGLMFTIDQQGHARQVLDEFGKGARCK